MTNERHVPYFATASLRKLINSLNQKNDITVLKAEARSCEEEEIGKDSQIGFKEKERTINEITIDYSGGSIYKNRVISKLRESEQHDMGISKIRIRTNADEEIKKAIKQPWLRKDGRETDILEKISLVDLDHCYVDFENEKIDFDWNERKANQRTFKDYWSNINKCEVCSAPLETHGFKHTTLKTKDIDFPWIRATLKKSQRPEINPHVNVIASWIYQNIVKPTELGRMFNYRLGKEDQWILEGV